MDKNFASFADASGLLTEGAEFRPESIDYADTLKCSALSDSVFRRCISFGREENALDCNRFCRRLRFEACHFIGGEQAAIVIKGGCSDIVFSDCLLDRSASSWCDVLLDDWSDQSREVSRGVDLRGLRRMDGSKVRIVIGRGWGLVLPTYDKEHAEILCVKSAGVHFYNVAKRLSTITRK